MQPPCCSAVKHQSEQIRGSCKRWWPPSASHSFLSSPCTRRLSPFTNIWSVCKGITRRCCNISAIIENPPMLTTLRQEMASPRAWRPTAQSSKSMGNRLEFFQAPSIISGFHLDIFTSNYPSHRVHPQYWQTRLRQYRVRPCNF